MSYPSAQDALLLRHCKAMGLALVKLAPVAVMSLLLHRECEILWDISLFIRYLNVYNVACFKLINYRVGNSN